MHSNGGQRIKSRVALFLATLLLASCDKPMTSNEAAAHSVDALFASYVSAIQPGVAVMIIRDGKIQHQGSYGFADIDEAVPITADTNFRLASFSKQFAAMAIMILEEDGRLSYDDPVSRYVPELAPYPDVTIRHLLLHTGGLPDYYDVIDTSGGIPTNEDAAKLLGELASPVFAPGERYEYSNPGYDMLGPVVAAAAGQSFVSFVKARIFDPLGMHNSLVHDHTYPEIPNRAFGYAANDNGFRLDDNDPLNGIVGSGGIYSSLNDLYRWDQALYGERLVSHATLELAFSPGTNNGGASLDYGFGWRIDQAGDYKRLRHGGSWVGFRTHIARVPEQHFSIIILSNRGDFEPDDFIDPITEFYLGPYTAKVSAARLATIYAE
jgi:CubicO group peptidase (beta-lactamase class C family)